MPGDKITISLLVRIQRGLMIQDAQLMYGVNDVVRQHGSLVRSYSF